jgi:hypothetical protein
MRRFAVPLALLAIVGVAVFVALRGTEDASAPTSAPPERPAPQERPRTPRVRAEQRAATPPPKSVRVAVKSADGTPIAGARVELVRGPETEQLMPWLDAAPAFDAPRVAFSADAADDGTAVVEDVAEGRWFVVASAPGFAKHVLYGVTRGADGSGVDASAVLLRGTTFSGVVLDPGGAPAKGVRLMLAPRSPWPNDAERLRATTGADGRYRFDDVEEGVYSFSYEVKPGVVVDEAQVLVPGTSGLDVRMDEGATIEGTVRDADTDATIAGARVAAWQVRPARISVWGDTWTLLDVTTADHLGRFTLHTWRRRAEVWFYAIDAEGYAPGPVNDMDRREPGAVTDGQRLVADLRVRKCGTVIGTLTGPDGPLSGYDVRVDPNECPRARPPGGWHCVTGADGKFRIDRVPAGGATVGGQDQRIAFRFLDDVPIDVKSGAETLQDLHADLRRVRATGLVVDANNAPVAGVDVTAQGAKATTDAEGRFSVEATFLGSTATALLRHDGFRNAEILLTTDSTDLGGHPYQLSRVTTIDGSVVRENGSPIGGIRVRLVNGVEGVERSFANWGGGTETVTAVDGTFRISAARAADQSWFDVRHGDEFPTRPDPDEALPTITFPDVSRVAGRVVAADGGVAVPGARICDQYGLLIATTDADGKFSVEVASAEAGSLHVECDGWSRIALADNAAEQTVTLPRRRSIAGVVRRADGTPVPGLRVEAGSPDHPDGNIDWTQTSATYANGRFILPDLDDGEWLLAIADPASLGVASTRTATKAGTANVVLVAAPSAKLVVEVADGEGNIVNDADVHAIPDTVGLAPVHAVSSVEGRTELALAAGAAYRLRVEKNDFEPVELASVRAGGDPVRVVLTAKPR